MTSGCIRKQGDIFIARQQGVRFLLIALLEFNPDVSLLEGAIYERFVLENITLLPFIRILPWKFPVIALKISINGGSEVGRCFVPIFCGIISIVGWSDNMSS
ncbi:hypothetical protein NPIL_317111 [Nephila pilipes]|uniref:Uncharacterized protein n=1 Tax=Nephila pilipes TaxID=299642 RepID=A0A8X6MG37_NEPPI|nr:hypothetical protein NPIL_317111 [Nephila pilipes]